MIPQRKRKISGGEQQETVEPPAEKKDLAHVRTDQFNTD